MTDEELTHEQTVFAKVQALLREEGCMIQTIIQADPVGTDASRAFLTARWGVVKLLQRDNDVADATDQ